MKCKATTKSGKPCKRITRVSDYCYAHRRYRNKSSKSSKSSSSVGRQHLIKPPTKPQHKQLINRHQDYYYPFGRNFTFNF